MELCCEASRDRRVTELRLGRVPRQSGETRRPLEELSIHPLHPVSGASMHIPHEQSPGFLQPCCESRWPANQPRGPVFWRIPICDRQSSLPREGLCPRYSPFDLSPLTEAVPDLSTYLPTQCWVCLSHNLGHIGVFQPVSLVFSEKCSTCQYIFNDSGE